MCELLVIVETGDVLVIFSDNHEFGGMELSNPAWRVIKVPEVDITILANLTSPGVATIPHGPTTFRLFFLNPTMLPVAGETISLAALRAIQTKRDPL